MEDGQPVPGSLYVYIPNKGAPIFFTVAFATSAVGHIWQCHRYKCFKLIGLQPLCAVFFTAGYALREYGAFHYLYNSTNLYIYIMSQVFIYICPPLLELSNYHVLGRIFSYVPYFAPLPPGRVLSTFGVLMALVETLNSLGVSLSANPTSTHATQQTGSNLTIAALAIQLAVIVTFVCLAGLFHLRCARAHIHTNRAVRTLLLTMYASMALILIRCIYRLVEHLGNTTVRLSDPASLRTLSPILRYEWFFQVFEASLMLINSVLWNVWNPGRYLPRKHHVYLAPDGRGEIEGQDVEDERPLLKKAGAVLSFGLLWRRKEGNLSFEELHNYPVAERRADSGLQGGNQST